MRYRIRGIRPKAVKEESSDPKLSIIVKGAKFEIFQISNDCFINIC